MILVHGSRRLAAYALLLALFAPIAATADNVVINGVSFQVDEVSKTDELNSKLTIGQDSVIIPSSEVENRIVKLYLERPNLSARLSGASLQKFAAESVGKGKVDWASWALRLLLSKASASEDAIKLIEQILKVDDRVHESVAIDVSKKILIDLEADKDQLSVPGSEVFILLAGIDNSAWVREHALRIALDRRAETRSYFKEMILKAFRARDFDRARKILGLSGALYGESDAELDELKVLNARVSMALRSAELGDVDPLYTLFQVYKSEPRMEEIISPVLIEAIHREANRAFVSGNSARVLEILARIDFARRTPTTHDLVIRALDSLDPESVRVLGDPIVKEFLLALGQHDERIKQGYMLAIEREIKQLIDSGEIDAVSDSIERAAAFRPDPSVDNDAHRFRQALAYLDRGMDFSAKNRIAEIQTGLSLAQRAKLFTAGLYGNPWVYISLGLIPTFFFFYLIAKDIRIRKERRASSSYRPVEPTEPHFSDEEAPKSFVSSRARTLTPLMKDYRELLGVLGLKSGVDVRTIKATYRQLIKTVHPDLNKDLSDADKERFVSLTRAYERLLELRKEMGMAE